MTGFTVTICYGFKLWKMNEIFQLLPSTNAGRYYTTEPSLLKYLRQHVMCHYSEQEFWFHILKSDENYFDCTVSWSSLSLPSGVQMFWAHNISQFFV
jgi:hypothetical protein